MTVLNTRWRFDKNAKKESNFAKQKNYLKISETLFTFKLYAEEHFSF